MDASDSNMLKQDWVPAGLDLNRPSAARMYDYLLGGYHNFEVDRDFAEQAIKAYPGTVLAAKVNRSFLRRAVEFLANDGVEQYIDIGSGIPTAGHIHEIAQKNNANARVLYVDIDPVAVAHGEYILRGNANAGIIMADARQPEAILGHDCTLRLIDFRRPLAVLFLAIVHFITDDKEAKGVIRAFTKEMAPGSWMAISHPTFDGAPAEVKERYAAIAQRATLSVKHRTHQEVEALLEGLSLVEPGLVHAPLWRPETSDDHGLDRPAETLSLAAVARVN